MTIFARLAFCAALLLLGCVSPEEQRAMDQQRCAGFGFALGSEGMASCLMQTAQQREAQQAAQSREDARNQMLANQMRQQREQAQHAADAAASEKQQSDIMRMMSSPTPGGIGLPAMNTSNCTVRTGTNAGSMTCP